MTTSDPFDGLSIHGRAAFFEDAMTLVVADLHVGREETSGVDFPLGEREDLLERLDALLARFDSETVVLAGDVVHPFDRPSAGIRRTLERIEETCRNAGVRPKLVAGNHDVALASAWDGDVHETVVIEPADAAEDDTPDVDATRTVVCHGHAEPAERGDRYVIGHVHPTIVIEGDRRPCFLVGERTYRDGDLLVLPAFNRLAPGVVVNDMSTDAFGSPLVTDADSLAPLVYDEAAQETLRFPALGRLRDLL